MSLGLIGKKLGMTQIYKADGSAVAVTVISVAGNQVLQVKKSAEKDGYSAVQVGFDDQKEKRMNKAQLGHFKKWGAEAPKRKIVEFRVAGDDQLPQAGAKLGPEAFVAGAPVDVIGVTKGKGFQGVVKRHNFAGQPAAHGHMMHRRTGSIGCRLTPGLVWKNQKMPGHMGVVRRTVQNLEIVQSRPEEGVLLVSGSVPGNKGTYVIIRAAKKKAQPENK
ncbi:MAG: 50S ribosomal protein L3 [Verrucomicrobiaceae bacterium]|nr:50S ribosomal protein L3 [Verrucomicrobiaceae bacterium]